MRANRRIKGKKGQSISTKISTQTGQQLCFEHTPGGEPGIVFCGGFKSDMQGNKACFLEELCKQLQWQYTRFDYRGHGQSDGEFTQCNLDDWIEDACTILDNVCTGPQILVGSSMGVWVALRAAQARPERVNALLGIAAAVDFTEELIWNELSPADQQTLQSGAEWVLPSNSDPTQTYAITMALIDSGRRNALLNQDINIHCPVRLLHGCADTDVPFSLSLKLLNQLQSADVQLNLIKSADHRFSDSTSLKLIESTLKRLRVQLTST